jgi:hypothetical protein
MVRFLENFGLKFRTILHRPQPNPHLLVKIGKKKTPKGEAPAPDFLRTLVSSSAKSSTAHNQTYTCLLKSERRKHPKERHLHQNVRPPHMEVETL